MEITSSSLTPVYHWWIMWLCMYTYMQYTQTHTLRKHAEVTGFIDGKKCVCVCLVKLYEHKRRGDQGLLGRTNDISATFLQPKQQRGGFYCALTNLWLQVTVYIQLNRYPQVYHVVNLLSILNARVPEDSNIIQNRKWGRFNELHAVNVHTVYWVQDGYSFD